VIFAITTLLSALSISCVGAYFSILGLATIFPGSQVSVVIMGIVLELGKVIAAVWLHRNWKIAPWVVKGYLCFAVLVLMGITSLGIFGFLSKSHIEHQAQTTHEITLIQTLETKISKEKGLITQYENYVSASQDRLNNTGNQSNIEIEREEKRIAQLLSSLDKDVAIEQERINKLTSRRKELDDALTTLQASSGGLFSNKKKKIEELKAQQGPERLELSASIKTYNDNIEKFREAVNLEIATLRDNIKAFRTQGGTNVKDLQAEVEKTNGLIRDAMDRVTEFEKEKLSYGEKIRALEAEIGPLKYVAEAIQDMGGSELAADKAVRAIILVLMLVFDPLAILLVIAAHMSLTKAFGRPYDKLSDHIKAEHKPPNPKEAEKTTPESPNLPPPAGVVEKKIERSTSPRDNKDADSNGWMVTGK